MRDNTVPDSIQADAVAAARRYIACWNETDGDRRRALLAQFWQPGASYVDPLMQGTGIDEIDGLIAAVQGRFAGHSFTLKEGVDAHNDCLRFSWSLEQNGVARPRPAVEGTDFARLDEAGRFVSVTGFLDAVNL